MRIRPLSRPWLYPTGSGRRRCGLTHRAALPILDTCPAAHQAMMDYMAKTFPGAFSGYKLRVVESHQATKKDTSGTAKAVVASFVEMGIPFDVSQIELVREPKEQVGTAWGGGEGGVGGWVGAGWGARAGMVLGWLVGPAGLVGRTMRQLSRTQTLPCETLSFGHAPVSAVLAVRDHTTPHHSVPRSTTSPNPHCVAASRRPLCLTWYPRWS